MLIFAQASAACSFSYKLGSVFGKEDESPGTGPSLAAGGAPHAAALPPESDLVFAKAAAAEALARRDKDVSIPWENPGTGARGTVTPIASSYTQDGMECRSFLVSYVQQNVETWIEGAACRTRDGKWEVRNLKPWQHS